MHPLLHPGACMVQRLVPNPKSIASKRGNPWPSRASRRWPRRGPCAGTPPPAAARRPPRGPSGRRGSARGRRWAGGCRPRRPPRPRRPAAPGRAPPRCTGSGFRAMTSSTGGQSVGSAGWPGVWGRTPAVSTTLDHSSPSSLSRLSASMRLRAPSLVSALWTYVFTVLRVRPSASAISGLVSPMEMCLRMSYSRLVRA
jgi:hypothetical protein